MTHDITITRIVECMSWFEAGPCGLLVLLLLSAKVICNSLSSASHFIELQLSWYIIRVLLNGSSIPPGTVNQF
ncbi:hypothetical protein EV426DRAFT_61674 [Tirmania nivea]|nr:hypothetical protein EV426DRAFT_61674 [Tirmania nivea]